MDRRIFHIFWPGSCDPAVNVAISRGNTLGKESIPHAGLLLHLLLAGAAQLRMARTQHMWSHMQKPRQTQGEDVYYLYAATSRWR